CGAFRDRRPSRVCHCRGSRLWHCLPGCVFPDVAAAAACAHSGRVGHDGCPLHPGRFIFRLSAASHRGRGQERTLMPLFDRKDKSRYATFTRRSLMMSGGMTAIFAVLGGRLYQLQIANGDQYKTQAEANRVSQHLMPPPRGRIVDRFGVELANNRRNYRVLLVAEQATDGVETALDRITKIIELSDRQKQKVLRDISEN